MASAIFAIRLWFLNILSPLELIILGSILGGAIYIALIRVLAPKLLKQVFEIAQVMAQGSKADSN